MGGIVYCLFTPISTLGSAGGDALDVELLHDDKQHRDGDSHQDAACAEAGEVAVDQSLLQHVVQADGNRPVRADTGVQDHLCHNKVGPRGQEGADNGVHQDRAGHRDNDLEEDARFGSAVQLGGLTQCHRHRIKEALADQVAKAGGARVHHDQTGVRVGQVHVLQNKVHSNHGQNAGEQVDRDGQVLQQPAAFEAAAAYGVSHHQHKAGGYHTVKACHNQGVHEPARELCNRVRLCHNAGVVPQGKAFRHKAGKVDAFIGGERGQQQPGNGQQPDTRQQRQDKMADDGENCFLDAALFELLLHGGIVDGSGTQENVASFLLIKWKHTTVNTAQTINTMMPSTAAIL